MHHGQGEPRGHSRVNGVAALPQNLESRVGCEVMNAHHHAVLRPHWLLAPESKRMIGLLGDRARNQEGCGKNKKEGPKRHGSQHKREMRQD